MRIDTHNHAIPARALDLLKRDPVYRVTIEGNRWHGGNHVDFDLLPSFTDPTAKLAELDRCRIDLALVSVAPPLFYYELEAEPAVALARAVNEGLAEFCSASPDRLRWLAHLPLQEPFMALDCLVEAVGMEGCVGIEVGSSVAGVRLDDPRLDPFWNAAGRHGLPVMIHPDFTYGRSPGLEPYYLNNVVGLLLETTLTVERLICAGVLERHRDATVLLVHAGGFFPYQAGRLRHARTVRPELANAPDDPWASRSQVFFDCITHDPEALRFLLRKAGLAQVVLGTDLPFDMGTLDPIGGLSAAVGAREVNAIAGSNPARLFDL